MDKLPGSGCATFAGCLAAPDGETIEMAPGDGNVAQCQADGSWRTLMENPFHAHYAGLLDQVPAALVPQVC